MIRQSVLSCPRYKRCTEGGRTFTVRAIQEWNKLNVDLKRSPCTKHFKGSLYKSILKINLLPNHLLISSSFTYLFICLFFYISHTC